MKWTHGQHHKCKETKTLILIIKPHCFPRRKLLKWIIIPKILFLGNIYSLLLLFFYPALSMHPKPSIPDKNLFVLYCTIFFIFIIFTLELRSTSACTWHDSYSLPSFLCSYLPFLYTVEILRLEGKSLLYCL